MHRARGTAMHGSDWPAISDAVHDLTSSMQTHSLPRLKDARDCKKIYVEKKIEIKIRTHTKITQKSHKKTHKKQTKTNNNINIGFLIVSVVALMQPWSLQN